MLKRLAVIAISAVATISLAAGPALADNTAVLISKHATRSPSHLRLFVKVRVVCSPDTTDAILSGYADQTNPAGDTQEGYGAVIGISSFECTGEEENVILPIRRPTGGFNWRAGEAAVHDVCFFTSDPSGEFSSTLKGRTVSVT